MDCDFTGDCDGKGEVVCACECEHCVEDTEHVAICEGCPKCEDNEELCPTNGHILYEGTPPDGSAADVMFVERCERGNCAHSRLVTRAIFCKEMGKHKSPQPSLDPRYDVCTWCGSAFAKAIAS